MKREEELSAEVQKEHDAMQEATGRGMSWRHEAIRLRKNWIERDEKGLH